MKINLQGGFGEKGRTSVLLQDGNCAVMLDAGIKVGAMPDDYHPKLALAAREIDALMISHAHEDHIGAVCWLHRRGFDGPIFMTSETLAEMQNTLTQYAVPDDLAAVPVGQMDIRIFSPGDTVKAGSFRVMTGHSGHVSGGVWMCACDTGGTRVLYAGDVVPSSAVFPMATFPKSDLLLLDASYGTDSVSRAERVEEILNWVANQKRGCLLPTPLSGRSLELIAQMPGVFAIEESMRAPIMLQIDGISGYANATSQSLAKRLAGALDWSVGTPFPEMPLLVHDGMGSAGPAAVAIPDAVAAGVPILLTGHLPAGSPAAAYKASGAADWIRMPTHPTLSENVALWRVSDCPPTFGHSCDSGALSGLKMHIPTLLEKTLTGQAYSILGRAINADTDFQ